MAQKMIPILALTLGGCVGAWPGGSTADGLDEARAFFIYPGSNSDFGWTQAHDDARLELQDELGITTNFAAFISNADAESTIADALTDDYNVVITASSGYIPATLSAASNNAESYFLSCCGSFSAHNLNSYFGRMYQPLYVAGSVAAKMSCTKKIGVVAAMPTPQFVRHINAFTLGARSVDPEVTVEIRWLDSFFDPDLEVQFADELVDAGNDVLLVQTNSTIVVEQSATRTVTCDNKGGVSTPVYSVAYHNKGGCDVAPDRCLTSAYWNWAPYYGDRVRSLLDGTWNPTDVGWQPWIDGEDSVVQLRMWPGFVPGDIRIDADELAAEVRRGPTQAPFVGPVRANDGQVKITANTELDDEALDRICWFVEGVVVRTDEEETPAVVPSSCQGDR